MSAMPVAAMQAILRANRPGLALAAPPGRDPGDESPEAYLTRPPKHSVFFQSRLNERGRRVYLTAEPRRARQHRNLDDLLPLYASPVVEIRVR